MRPDRFKREGIKMALTGASLDVSLVGRQGVTLANDTASLTAVVGAARAVVGAFCKQTSPLFLGVAYICPGALTYINHCDGSDHQHGCGQHV